MCTVFAASRVGSFSPRAAGERLIVWPVDVNTLASDALSLCALSPTVGRVATDLIDFDGNQLETLPARGFAPADFGALQQRLSRLVVVGVVQQGDEPSRRGLTLAPSADFRVRPHPRVLKLWIRRFAASRLCHVICLSRDVR